MIHTLKQTIFLPMLFLSVSATQAMQVGPVTSLALKAGALAGLSFRLQQALKDKKLVSTKPIPERETVILLALILAGLASLNSESNSALLPCRVQQLVEGADIIWLGQALIQLTNSIYNYSLTFSPASPEQQKELCAICKEPASDARSACSFCEQHIFCTTCIRKWYHQNEYGNPCPLCRHPLRLELPKTAAEYVLTMATIPEERRILAITSKLLTCLLCMLVIHKIQNLPGLC